MIRRSTSNKPISSRKKYMNITVLALDRFFNIDVDPLLPNSWFIAETMKWIMKRLPSEEIPFLDIIYNKTKNIKLEPEDEIREGLEDGNVVELSPSRWDQNLALKHEPVDSWISDSRSNATGIQEVDVFFWGKDLGMTLSNKNQCAIIQDKLRFSKIPAFDILVRDSILSSIDGKCIKRQGLQRIMKALKRRPITITFQLPSNSKEDRVSSSSFVQIARGRTNTDSSIMREIAIQNQQNTTTSTSHDDMKVNNSCCKGKENATTGRKLSNVVGRNQELAEEVDQVDEGRKLKSSCSSHFAAKSLNLRRTSGTNENPEKKIIDTLDDLYHQLSENEKHRKEIVHRIELFQKRLEGVNPQRAKIYLQNTLNRREDFLLESLQRAGFAVSSLSYQPPTPSECSSRRSVRTDRPRAKHLTMRSDVSVSSITSVDRRGFKENTRDSWINSSKDAPGVGSYNVGYQSTLDKRGGVLPQHSTSRDSWIKRSCAPGVGTYTVENKLRVKGGDIGDTPRLLLNAL